MSLENIYLSFLQSSSGKHLSEEKVIKEIDRLLEKRKSEQQKSQKEVSTSNNTSTQNT